MNNKFVVQNEGKNHRGNYQISVSFDMFGNSRCQEPEAFVCCLETRMQEAFNKWMEYANIGANKFKIKNIKWNE